jgi:3',5'-cyclic AMP phosphodiesterase CpdA
MPKSIQIASDLHIDINLDISTFIRKTGDILCLAGDICSCGDKYGFQLFKTFLSRECQKYEYVIHVAGNHEFYSDDFISIEEIKTNLRNLEDEFPNYRFLDDDVLEIQNDERKLIFIGATLWSFIPDSCAKIVKKNINDYRMISRLISTSVFSDVFKSGSENTDVEIKGFIRRLTVEDTQEFHSKSKKFLYETIEKYKQHENVDVVLLTHHKPLWDRNPLRDERIQTAFETHMSYLLVSPVRLAIHGHTHEPYDKTLESGTRAVSNPYGYRTECPDYNESFCVSL